MSEFKEKTVTTEQLESLYSSTEENKKDVLATIVSPHTHKTVEITSDVDEAMELAVAHQNESIAVDKPRDKKLLRKIDLFLMPVMCLLYCFQFMDKTTNSYAAILGLRKDLKMVGNQFAWTGSAFYLGYLVFEYPAVRLLQRFPVAKTVGVFVVLWGIILCLHSVPKYAGFIVLRVILGALESSITPAFVIITGQYYTRDEVFLRISFWFASNGIGIILGTGAISYNVFKHATEYSITAWKLVFIVTGSLTIFLGLVILLHNPDTPAKAWFLTEEEKVLVVNRIRVNQQGFGNKHFKLDQFKEAFLDYKTWLFFSFAVTGNIPNGGLTNFTSILLSEGLGYSTSQTLLMQMPSGAIEFLGCVAFAYFSRFVKSRLSFAILAQSIALIGQFMLSFSKNRKAALAGFWINSVGPVGGICILAALSSNVAGHTKKTTVSAIFLIGYCVGNLIGPQTFLAKEAPHYTTAKICIVVFGSVCLGILGVIFLSYKYENRKRDDADVDAGEYANIANIEFLDLTDRQNPYFRYTI